MPTHRMAPGRVSCFRTPLQPVPFERVPRFRASLQSVGTASEQPFTRVRRFTDPLQFMRAGFVASEWPLLYQTVQIVFSNRSLYCSLQTLGNMRQTIKNEKATCQKALPFKAFKTHETQRKNVLYNSIPPTSTMKTDISWCKQAYPKGQACLFSCKNASSIPLLPFRFAGIHEQAHKQIFPSRTR